jgi:hypothetical protein
MNRVLLGIGLAASVLLLALSALLVIVSAMSMGGQDLTLIAFLLVGLSAFAMVQFVRRWRRV